ncbi:hypothetical protein JWJ90_18770 [Desulfobulbus rhabdoformis]|jgi:hypothetical protein|uniref:hypothetical protein n=1 Tax=Desulfobulbus rhabdoformis TaxID=34032 RepID=UPI001965B2E5|nr:hypothetical protein [Desulfobulbus rhabdoformis]MBM9616313.1 hypothetical protein [Desulfobulbus rhabdoformis]
MKKKKYFALPDSEISKLFDKFSYPISKSALDETQKRTAISISKILWILFVSSRDSEQNVYECLDQIEGIDHEANLSIGAVYFYKMKKALSRVEIIKLRNHYKNENNLNKIQEWHIE